jgi:hypothetical protein
MEEIIEKESKGIKRKKKHQKNKGKNRRKGRQRREKTLAQNVNGLGTHGAYKEELVKAGVWVEYATSPHKMSNYGENHRKGIKKGKRKKRKQKKRT